MKYFKNVRTLAELRSTYKNLVKELHPDNTKTGNEAAFKEMISEYEMLFESLKNGASEDSKKDYDINIDAALREALNRVINLNVNIEIIGTWIWITGNTYAVKEELKASGFKWCSNKKAWSWHYGDFKKFGKRKNSMQDIRNKYGSQTIKKESDKNKIE